MNAYIESITDEDDVYEDDVAKRVYATTKGGKEIIIYSYKGYWNIKFSSGGQLPSALKGRWTTYQYAATAVDGYLAHEPEPKPKTPKKTQKKSETKAA